MPAKRPDGARGHLRPEPAWDAHRRELNHRSWHRSWSVAARASWAIALGEYLIQVPANRIAYARLDLGEPEIMHEAITLAVLVPFALLYMKQPLRLNDLCAGLYLCGAGGSATPWPPPTRR